MGLMASETKSVLDADGNVIGECEYSEGVPHGQVRHWTSSGQPTMEACLHQGDYHGPYQSWWHNGNTKELGVYHFGERIGIYKWYTESGDLWQEHDYGPAP